MKHTILTLCSILILSISFCQTHNRQDIDQICAQQKMFLSSGNYAMANVKADSCLKWSSKLNYAPGLAYGYRTKGYYHFLTGDSTAGYNYFLKSLEIATSNGDIKNMGLAYGSLAFYWMHRADHYQAQNNLIKAREAFESINDIEHLAIVSGNEGVLQINLGNYDMALAKCIESIGQARASGNKEQEILSNCNAARSLQLLRETDSALTFAEHAIQLCAPISMIPYRVLAYNVAGEIYVSLGEYDKAIESVETCISIVGSGSKVTNILKLTPIGEDVLNALTFNKAYYLVLANRLNEAKSYISQLSEKENSGNGLAFRLQYLQFLIAFIEKNTEELEKRADILCDMSASSNDYYQFNVCEAATIYKRFSQSDNWRELVHLDSAFNLLDKRLNAKVRENAIVIENAYKFKLEIASREFQTKLESQKSLALGLKNDLLQSENTRKADSIKQKNVLLGKADSMNLVVKSRNTYLHRLNAAVERKNLVITWAWISSISLIILAIYLVYKLRIQQKLKDEYVSKLTLLNKALSSHFLSRYLRQMSNEDISVALSNRLKNLEHLYSQMFEVTAKDKITLKTELEIGTDYLQLEKDVYPGRIAYSIEIGPPMIDASKVVLSQPLVLHTLLENIIKHAVIPGRSMVNITCKIRVYTDWTTIEVFNTGSVFDEDKAKSLVRNISKKTSALFVLIRRMRKISSKNRPPYLIDIVNKTDGVLISINVPSKTEMHYAA